jgi:hypothetical protein
VRAFYFPRHHDGLAELVRGEWSRAVVSSWQVFDA